MTQVTIGSLFSPNLKLNFKLAGPTLKNKAKEVAEKFKNLSPEEVENILSCEDSFSICEVALKKDCVIVDQPSGVKENLVFGSVEGVKLILDTNITPELFADYIVRETVANIQNSRKISGMTPQDNATVYISATSESVLNTIISNFEYIVKETNTTAIHLDDRVKNSNSTVAGELTEIYSKKYKGDYINFVTLHTHINGEFQTYFMDEN